MFDYLTTKGVKHPKNDYMEAAPNTGEGHVSLKNMFGDVDKD